MTLYLKTIGGYVAWAGEPIDDVRHPLGIETAWTAEELATIGLYVPAAADPVPEGKVSMGMTVEDVAGVPTYVHQLRDRTLAEATEEARRLVAAHVDAVAAARGYDNGAACASYATSTVAKWAAEATVFVAWRDAVWTSVFALLASVEAGTATVPTAEALIAGLPVVEWPAST
jgi:hypothetical protein